MAIAFVRSVRTSVKIKSVKEIFVDFDICHQMATAKIVLRDLDVHFGFQISKL